MVSQSRTHGFLDLRQFDDTAAMETSFANAAQISVSYCEPWANKEAPLLFRPQMPFGKGWYQYRWGPEFLADCNDAATGIEYNRLEKGIAHFYVDQKSFDAAAGAAALMAKYGVQRRVISREELLKIEPAFKQYADHIVGGTFTASDESGDAREFTQQLAVRCAARGVQFLWNHDVLSLNKVGGSLDTVSVQDRATFKILKPELAPQVSFIDDSVKCAMSRLGDTLRIAGTIEVGGYDTGLDSALSRARCHMLARRVETVFPGVCDTRLETEGGKLWVNAGQGTLGWTHGAGSGKAVAELISGSKPEMNFRFYQE